MFNSTQYSDFTVCCRDRNFHIHKAIVGPQNEFFSNAFKSEYKVGSHIQRGVAHKFSAEIKQEGLDNTIHLQQEPSCVIEALLSSFYGIHYDHQGCHLCCAGATGFHVLVFVAADKFLMTALKAKAKEKFIKVADEQFSEMDKFENFFVTVKDVYERTPLEDIRKPLIDIACENNVALFSENKENRWIFESVPEFCRDLLSVLLDKNAAYEKLIKDLRGPNCYACLDQHPETCHVCYGLGISQYRYPTIGTNGLLRSTPQTTSTQYPFRGHNASGLAAPPPGHSQTASQTAVPSPSAARMPSVFSQQPHPGNRT